MRTIQTESGSWYIVNNGRISREPSPMWNWLDDPIDNEIFTLRAPVEQGKGMRVYLPALDRELVTSAVVEITDGWY